MSNRDDGQDFKVTDRRLFDDAGEIREDRAREKRDPVAEGSQEVPPGSGGGEEAKKGAGEIDFSSFVISLATTAMVHLGEAPAGSEAPPENLDAAKQMIDILGMLETKTEGNLSPEEARLIHDVLYELRMKFLAKKKVVQL